jgi:hypothetical protein
VAHESRVCLVDGRLSYPDDHIEVDNRLAWFLGSLGTLYPGAFYVHLTRDPERVASSMVRRWEQKIWLRRAGALKHPRRTLRHVTAYLEDPFSTERALDMKAFGYGILMPTGPWRPNERHDVCRLMVDTMNANIRHFLEDKRHLGVRVENFHDDVSRLWGAIGAEGDKRAALAELDIHYNEGL